MTLDPSKGLFDLLKDLWQSIASNLKAQILVFALLVLILGLVFAVLLPAYQPWILGALGLLLLSSLAIYLFEARRAPPASTASAPVQPAAAAQPSTVSAPAQPAVVTLDALRDAYLDSLVADCQRARLVGIDPKSVDPRRKPFTLEKLYVSLDTKTQREVEEDGEKKMHPLPALEALEAAPGGRMALLGLPGSGKTTFVRYLSLRHAQACRRAAASVSDDLPGWKGAPLLPVILPLGRLAESISSQAARGSAEMVEQFLQRTLQGSDDPSIGRYAGYLLDDLRRRPALFLFDGLDEVADLSLRPLVVQAVEAFAARYAAQPASRFLVTCRTFSYTDERWKLAGWATHELAAFTKEQVAAFVDAWHDESIRVDPGRKDDYERKRLQLKEVLRPGDRRRLWEIADTPLILTLMAVVHTTRGELPDARALVYEECTRQLLIQWEAERSVLGQSQRTDLRTALEVAEVTLYNALQEVAYHAHERQAGDPKRGGAALVTEDLLRADLWAAFDDEAKVRTFLSYCESANGLLLWQGVAPLPDAPPDSPPRRVYAFPHLTFQEYLAARYLGRMANLGEKARLHLDRSDRWREVVMLLGEHICFRDGNYEQMDALLNALAPDPFPAQPSPQDWRALWMAGDLLMLYRRAFPRRGEQHGRIPHGLARLLKSGALTSIERAAAGGALARLGQEGAGDPRFDPQRLYLPSRADSLDDPLQLPDLWGFIHIPAGPFLMGSRRDDPGARENEFEQHVLELPDYYLARYPVTVAQFRLFVECTGYKVRDSDSLRGLSNHPVNWITWYEARDYCRWLDGELKAAAARRLEQAAALPPAEALFCRRLAQDGWQITIPSEAEWEKAARGPLPGAAPATSPSLSVSSLAPATPPSLSVSEREGGWGDERGRLYPWGFTFSSDCANTKETGLDAISPVGCFPQGQSVYGLLDMSGNVWEWTRSQYCSYPYDPQDGRETPPSSNDVWMAVRGGAYYSEPQSARCAYRDGYYPVNRYRNVGFRVVLLLCR